MADANLGYSTFNGQSEQHKRLIGFNKFNGTKSETKLYVSKSLRKMRLLGGIASKLKTINKFYKNNIYRGSTQIMRICMHILLYNRHKGYVNVHGG